MKIIFYKYRYHFSYRTEDWEEKFQIVDDILYSVKEHVQIIKNDLERQYNDSEHYRGLDFKIIKPTPTLIEKQIECNKQRILNIFDESVFLSEQLAKINHSI